MELIFKLFSEYFFSLFSVCNNPVKSITKMFHPCYYYQKTMKIWIPKTNNISIRQKYVDKFLSEVHHNKEYWFRLFKIFEISISFENFGSFGVNFSFGSKY